jgi:protein kinase A
MTQAVAQPQPLPALQTQQNLPSISNLINPPQHDGAGHSQPTQAPADPVMPSDNSDRLPDAQVAQAAQPESQPQSQARATKGKYGLADFELQRTLGTGSFGRVHLVQSKHNQRYYAVKVLKKQQVVKMKQVEHTNDERRMLQEVKHPFLITLWGTFQDSKNLYMVMDFVEGGELFSLLRKSQVSSEDVYFINCALTSPAAVPKSRREILRRWGHPGTWVFAFEGDYLSRLEAWELAPGPTWTS